MTRPQPSITIHRQIDERQTAVRNQILGAARRLIQELGHEAVGMEAIALEAGVSRPTMYRYFASKEHVVCEAALDWGNELAMRIPTSLGSINTSDNLINVVIKLVVEEANSNLPMVRATMTSVLALGPGADQFRRSVREMFSSLMSGSSKHVSAEMEASLTLLGRVFMADLTLLSVGDISAEQCLQELQTCAQRLLVVNSQK